MTFLPDTAVATRLLRTAESLAARVLEAEHLLLPRVVDAVAAGAIRLDDNGRVAGQLAVPFRHFYGAADLEEASRQLSQPLDRPALTLGRGHVTPDP
jgi:hypothetical protein